jgi:hypothetical protein
MFNLNQSRKSHNMRLSIYVDIFMDFYLYVFNKVIFHDKYFFSQLQIGHKT